MGRAERSGAEITGGGGGGGRRRAEEDGRIACGHAVDVVIGAGSGASRAEMAEGSVLDEQFEQLCELQDEDNADFVREVVHMFFADGEKKVNEVRELLDQDVVNFRQMEDTVHALKGSSASVGAFLVVRECSEFRHCCEAADKDACVASYAKIAAEFQRAKVELGARIS